MQADELKVQLYKKQGTSPKTKEKIWYPMVKPDRVLGIKGMKGSDGSTVSYIDALGVVQALHDSIQNALLQGDSFYLDGIGTFKLKVSGESTTDPTKLRADSKNLKTSITFTPEKSFKEYICNNVTYTYAGQNGTTSTSEDSQEETEETESENTDTENKSEVE